MIVNNVIHRQAVEWKRPFGRAAKTVCLNATFIPFDADVVATGAQLRRLIGVPVLHTFWMECADLDSYKVSCLSTYIPVCLLRWWMFLPNLSDRFSLRPSSAMKSRHG